MDERCFNFNIIAAKIVVVAECEIIWIMGCCGWSGVGIDFQTMTIKEDSVAAVIIVCVRNGCRAYIG